MSCNVNIKSFKSNNYSAVILSNLYQLWIKQEMTDLKFRIDNKTFHVHRLLMQICSPYFNSLLSLNLKEIQQDTIELSNVSTDIFELLLNYIYTGSITVDETNICDVIVAADYFGLNEICEYYCQYLCENLNEFNALDLFKFFNSYSYNNYAKRAHLYLCKNFSKLIKHDEIFLNIDFDIFYNFLINENLYVNSEFEIFDSIVRWLSFDYKCRCIYKEKLLDLIKVSYIKSIKLFNYLTNIKSNDVKISIANYLYEKFDGFDENQSLAASELALRKDFKFDEPRKYLRKSILIFGGIVDLSNDKLNNKIYCFDTVNSKIFPISNFLLSRSNHCVCEFNDLIFIAGGEINLCISDSVEIYDLDYFRHLIKEYYLKNRPSVESCVSNNNEESDSEDTSDFEEDEEVLANDNFNQNYKTVQSMIQSRTDFGMSTIDDKLFVFGGWIGSDVGNTIEYYSPIENKWFQVSSNLPSLRYEFSCVTLPNSSFIYLIGGTTPYETKLTLVERFDVSTFSWQLCAPMHEKRSGCACVVLNENIYVIGGYNGRTVLSSVEIYDPLNDRWYQIEGMNYPRYGCVASCIDNIIYVIGGISSMNSKQMVNKIEYYDSNLNKWFIISNKNLKLKIFKSAAVNV